MKLIKLTCLLLIFIHQNVLAICHPSYCNYSVNLDKPGFYTANVMSLKGNGFYSLLIDKPSNNTEFLIETKFKKNNGIPSFIAFNLSNTQPIELTFSKYLSYLSGSLTIKFFKQDNTGKRILVHESKIFYPSKYTSSSFSSPFNKVLNTPDLAAGFYVVEIWNQEQEYSSSEWFKISIVTQNGSVRSGGWIDNETENSAIFYIDTPQNVNFNLQFGKSFGDIGIDKPLMEIYI
jgi:hypothetical protein